MKLEQLSVFIENKVGRLTELTEALAKAEVNILALALADTSEFGILRMIVDDHQKAKKALKEISTTVTTTEVLGIEMDNSPGGLYEVIKKLSAHNINIEYMYSSPVENNKMMMIVRVKGSETEKTFNIMNKKPCTKVASEQKN